MNKARAAQIWDELERQLIEHCGLPNGRMLELARPGLIRRIGNALTGRAAAAKSVSPPLPQADAYAKRIKMRPVEMRPQPAQSAMRTVRMDTIHDPRLAELLERSCSRRTGYDGDDVVDYGRH